MAAEALGWTDPETLQKVLQTLFLLANIRNLYPMSRKKCDLSEENDGKSG
jgi:hypothetical protein